MTIKEFALITGISYAEVTKAVEQSPDYVSGKLIDYDPEVLRNAVTVYLREKERKGEHRLADIRRKLVSVYGMEAM